MDQDQSSPPSIPPEVLRLRIPSPERAAALSAPAQAAWEAALRRHDADRIPAFPATDPLLGDVRAVVGRLVQLGPLDEDAWGRDGTHQVLVAGTSHNAYLVRDSSAPAARMLDALRRFRARIHDGLPQRYQLLCRITGEHGLVVVGRSGCWGLFVEPLCALIGDALFIDLTQVDDHGRSPFLGEAELPPALPTTVPAAASPSDVVRAVVRCVQHDDQRRFVELLATERVVERTSGPELHYCYRPDVAAEWQAARDLLARDVVDIQPVAEGPIRWAHRSRALTPTLSMPGIEQVEVEVVHLTQDPQGSARLVERAELPRRYLLQRKDNGPWLLFLPHRR